MNDELVTIPQAAKFLGVCPGTVRKWIDQDLLKPQKLPPTKEGGKAIVRIARKSIVEFMNGGEK